MGIMIGIALEDKWAAAAVVRESGQYAGNPGKNNAGDVPSLGDIHPEKICDSDGSYLFSHENALKSYDSCVELLKKIKNRAQIFCGCAVDSAVISIPCDLNLKYWGVIKEAAKEAGFIPRLMTRAMAEAIYIGNVHAWSLDKPRFFLIIMEIGQGYEVSAFEWGDGVCEALWVESYPEIKKHPEEMEQVFREIQERKEWHKEGSSHAEIYFGGEMTEKIYSTILKFFGEDTVINGVENECACGAAIYTGKLTGSMLCRDILALSITSFGLYIKINEDRTEEFWDKDMTIPTKRSIIVDDEAELFEKEKLVIFSESSAGNFSVAGEFDLRDFLKRDNPDEIDRDKSFEVTVEVDANFDIKCSFAVLLEKNDEKVKDKEVFFSLFDKNQNRILADLIPNSSRKNIAAAERKESMSGKEDGAAAGKNAGKNCGKAQISAGASADASREIIMKLLPVIDDLEKSICYAGGHSDSGVAEGLRMIERKLFAILAEYDVKPIEAIGCEFSVDYHNAVSHVKDARYKENIVIEEVKKGYLHHGKVLRYSMVVVAN